MSAAPPVLDDLLAFLGLDEANYPADQAQDALDAALEAQAADCLVDPYTAALHQAALRRAAAILAARGAPLGTIDTGAFGAVPLMRFDPITNGLEADRLLGNFA